MTEPLISRAVLIKVIRDEDITGVVGVTNAVMEYLRSVLTPQTLDSGSQSAWDVGVVDGAAAYRRIFGDDL